MPMPIDLLEKRLRAARSDLDQVEKEALTAGRVDVPADDPEFQTWHSEVFGLLHDEFYKEWPHKNLVRIDFRAYAPGASDNASDYGALVDDEKVRFQRGVRKARELLDEVLERLASVSQTPFSTPSAIARCFGIPIVRY